MTRNSRPPNIPKPMAAFAAITTVVIISFLVLLLVTQLNEIQRVAREPSSSELLSRKESELKTPTIKPKSIPKQKWNKPVVIEPAPFEEEIGIYNLVNIEETNRENTRAAKFVAELIPRLNIVKTSVSENLVSTLQFPRNLKEIGLDRKDIGDKNNISHIFFYHYTVLIILNHDLYDEPHWLAFTATPMNRGASWQCRTSLLNSAYIPPECKNQKMPPNIYKLD